MSLVVAVADCCCNLCEISFVSRQRKITKRLLNCVCCCYCCIATMQLEHRDGCCYCCDGSRHAVVVAVVFVDSAVM